MVPPGWCGDLGWNRTSDLIRVKDALWPSELQGRNLQPQTGLNARMGDKLYGVPPVNVLHRENAVVSFLDIPSLEQPLLIRVIFGLAPEYSFWDNGSVLCFVLPVGV